jgi:hypothetical protein
VASGGVAAWDGRGRTRTERRRQRRVVRVRGGWGGRGAARGGGSYSSGAESTYVGGAFGRLP